MSKPKFGTVPYEIDFAKVHFAFPREQAREWGYDMVGLYSASSGNDISLVIRGRNLNKLRAAVVAGFRKARIEVVRLPEGHIIPSASIKKICEGASDTGRPLDEGKRSIVYFGAGFSPETHASARMILNQISSPKRRKEISVVKKTPEPARATS